jgi:hypothetical protein
MPITDMPNAAELPSANRLLRSTVIGMLTAFVLLVTVVLPAEYGVDPTGIGRVLGLTEMGELKVVLAKEAEAAEAAEAAARAASGTTGTESATTPATATQTAPVATRGGQLAARGADSRWTHVTEVTLVPTEGKEVKLVMTKGARAEFEWTAAGGAVNFDMHGDSTGAPNSYHSYRKGTGDRGDDGALVAAFDGSHGWFWRNRSREVVTITLRTRGEYSELKKMY